MLSDDRKKEIIEILDARLRKLKKPMNCPMCGHGGFSLVDGYFTPTIQEELGSVRLGGTSIPNIAIICTNCGFISHHAMGTLGLLPKKEEKKPEPAEQSDPKTKGGGE